jgi:hypothetical protein
MPPDSPQNRSALPRSRVVEVIERSTDHALRQLRQAGIPETEALLVIQRFSPFSVQVLRELDHLYREYEALLAEDPDRSPAHQEWFETRAGGLLLTLEAFIAALVTEAMNKAKEDYRSGLSQPREVITHVPAPPPSPGEKAWEKSARLLLHPLVLWSVGLHVWWLVWLLVSGSNTWAVIAVGITAFVVWLFEKAGLVFILTGGVVLLLVVLLFLVGVL